MTVPVVEEEIELPPGEVAALVEAEGDMQDSIADNLIITILSLWETFTEFYDGDAARAIAERIGRLVTTAQRLAGRATEAHLRQQVELLGEQLPQATIVDLPPALRPGADAAEVYTRPIRQVRYLESVEDVPRETATQTARERLERAALHDLQLARAVAAQQVLYRFPQASGWRRIIHPELGSVCGLCIAASDRVYQRINRMDIHPGCVVEGTEVSADGIGALTRRRYAGPVVVLRTRSGQELRVTPNHPVLTDQGWVSADRLRVGDRVVGRSGSQRPVRGGPDEQHRPTRVEDVWRSLTVAQGLLPRTVPLASEDLHGDGAVKGEVDVVFVDRHLADVGNVSFIEPCSELGLVDAGRGRSDLTAVRSFQELLMALLRPANSLVGVGQQRGTLLGVQSREPELVGFGLRADRYFSAPESPEDGGPSYAEVGRKLLNRLAGQVEFSDLVEVDVVSYTGHVYNFQTREGWYDASSVVVSNCKCTILPVVGSLDPGGQLNAEDLQRLYEAAGSTASRALAAVRIDTFEHGEMGSVLIPEGSGIKRPGQVKRDLSDQQLERRKAQLGRQVDEMRAKLNKRYDQWHADRLGQLEDLLEAA